MFIVTIEGGLLMPTVFVILLLSLVCLSVCLFQWFCWLTQLLFRFFLIYVRGLLVYWAWHDWFFSPLFIPLMNLFSLVLWLTPSFCPPVWEPFNYILLFWFGDHEWLYFVSSLWFCCLCDCFLVLLRQSLLYPCLPWLCRMVFLPCIPASGIISMPPCSASGSFTSAWLLICLEPNPLGACFLLGCFFVHFPLFGLLLHWIF